MIKGTVDQCTDLELMGWAFDMEKDEAPVVRIAVNSVVLDRITPDRPRPDLEAIGIRRPAGFLYRFETPLTFGDRVAVTVDEDVALQNSPVIYGREYMREFFLGKKDLRRALSYAFLEGAGIEIGALNNPLAVASGVKVRYVDRMDVPDLREQYPELAGSVLTAPDILDDGERLSRIDDESQDFVIANHFLEHCEDPIGCLKTFCRVLRPGGRLYLAVPDKTATFDRLRKTTSPAHLERDHRDGGARSRKQHFRQWAAFIQRKYGRDIHEAAESLETFRYSIHYHVWTFESFLEFLGRAVSGYLPDLDILLCMRHPPDEMICIAEKTGEKTWKI